MSGQGFGKAYYHEKSSTLLTVCYFVDHAAAAAAKLLQLCPTLCNPTDGSLPGSPVPGILNFCSFNSKSVFVICSNMEGFGQHYAKRRKSDRERPILYDISDIWNLKKYNELVKVTKKKQPHSNIEQTSGHKWGEKGKGKRGQQVQTISYKINYKDTLYSMGNIANILQ